MNRLGRSTSPYLRQHAENPVDWYPWGDDAFAVARSTDRPILLSVGYSACHWCHVMAHESFEDPSIAAVMNEHFVNVKVDREERPDVDAIYMHAVQALTGRGGWPMTVFLAPDGRPFFGGTYFPKSPGHGLPGFRQLLEAVHDAWRERRSDLLDQAGKLREVIESAGSVGTGETALPAVALLDAAADRALAQVDRRHGGFGPAPKFPQAMTLTFLLDRWVRTGAPDVLNAVTLTLDAMAAGGMYDQVGGGFHRYSVDAYWLVPHFEKMLYDQALLVRAYLRAWQATGEARYRRIVEETIEYVLRDLRRPGGGFAAAEDADSEGVEGKFYVWSLAEIEAICGSDAPEMIRHFGVTAGGNFQDPHTGHRGNILAAVDPLAPRSPAVERGLATLLSARAERVRPGLDDKVLLGWNALFLRALAESAAALRRTDWMEAARANAKFLATELRRADGRWLRAWPVVDDGILGYAEDYAGLLEALLTLAEVDEISWLGTAQDVADELLHLFHDDERGGFFTTGADAEPLIVRPKDVQDNATPAASSLAAEGLLRLVALTGNDHYRDFAVRWIASLGDLPGEHPTAFAHLLTAFEHAVTPAIEVAVVGMDDDPGRDALAAELHSRLLPVSVSAIAAPGEGSELTPLLAGRENERATAYVCERFVCRLPAATPEELRARLDDALAARI